MQTETQFVVGGYGRRFRVKDGAACLCGAYAAVNIGLLLGQFFK